MLTMLAGVSQKECTGGIETGTNEKLRDTYSQL